MGGPQELVDRPQFLQPVPAVLQGSGIARETGRIARRIDEALHLAARKLGALRPRRRAAGRAGQRRINRVPARQWIAEEVTSLGGDPTARGRRAAAWAASTACDRFRTAPTGRHGQAKGRRRRQTDLPAARHHRPRRRRRHASRLPRAGSPGGTRRAAGSTRASPNDSARHAPHRDRLGGARRDRPSSPEPSRAPAPPARPMPRLRLQGKIDAAVGPDQQVDAAISLVDDGIRAAALSGRTSSIAVPQCRQHRREGLAPDRPRRPATSTMRGLPRSWKPARTRRPCRRRTKSARRRSPRGLTSAGSTAGTTTAALRQGTRDQGDFPRCAGVGPPLLQTRTRRKRRSAPHGAALALPARAPAP